VTTREQLKRQIIAVLDALPAERLEEGADFIEFLRTTHAPAQPMYSPVALGGPWAGGSVNDTGIAEVRKEI